MLTTPTRGTDCPAAGHPPSPLRGARPRRRRPREGPRPRPAPAAGPASRRPSTPRSTRIRILRILSIRNIAITRRCLCRLRRKRRPLGGEGPHPQQPPPPPPRVRPIPAPASVPRRHMPCITTSSHSRRRSLDRVPRPSSYRPRHPGEASRGRWPT